MSRQSRVAVWSNSALYGRIEPRLTEPKFQKVRLSVLARALRFVLCRYYPPGHLTVSLVLMEQFHRHNFLCRGCSPLCL